MGKWLNPLKVFFICIFCMLAFICLRATWIWKNDGAEETVIFLVNAVYYFFLVIFCSTIIVPFIFPSWSKKRWHYLLFLFLVSSVFVLGNLFKNENYH